MHATLLFAFAPTLVLLHTADRRQCRVQTRAASCEKQPWDGRGPSLRTSLQGLQADYAERNEGASRHQVALQQPLFPNEWQLGKLQRREQRKQLPRPQPHKAAANYNNGHDGAPTCRLLVSPGYSSLCMPLLGAILLRSTTISSPIWPNRPPDAQTTAAARSSSAAANIGLNTQACAPSEDPAPTLLIGGGPWGTTPAVSNATRRPAPIWTPPTERRLHQKDELRAFVLYRAALLPCQHCASTALRPPPRAQPRWCRTQSGPRTRPTDSCFTGQHFCLANTAPRRR
jgi:hypothetical protein